MYAESELVVLPRSVPARVILIDGESHVPPSRRDEAQLFFVVHGRPTFVVDEDEATLEPEGIYLANPRALAAIESDGPFQVIALRFDVRRLAESLEDVEFRVNTATASNPRAVRPLIHLLAQIIKVNATEDERHRFKTSALLYSLLDELTQHFVALPTGGAPSSDKHRSRMRSLLRYIDEHYAEGLTLNQVADHEHLSAPYLSAFFKEHVGTTFSTYYNALRLDRAVDDLVTTDESVETVARRNGFRDPRAFVKVFKERFGVLPSQYRRDEQDKRGSDTRRSTTANAPPDTPLRLLAKYLPEESGESSSASSTDDPLAKIVAVETVDVGAKGRPLRHTYRKVTTVGRAKELMYQEVRDMLTGWQRDVGFEFIKFHGLFGDDMHVYREDKEGEPVYSFVLLDKVFDFLLSIGLKPFVELSFTPQEMALVPERTVFSAPFNVSPPARLDRWVALVEAFMAHMIDRYGQAEVASWLFSPWNEPDTGPTLFGFVDDAEFYTFYKATFDAVKGFGEWLRFGSPAMLVTYVENQDWMLDFLDFADGNKCRPDFVTVHFYDNDFSDDTLAESSPAEPAGLRLNKDQDTFHKTVRKLRLLLKDRGLKVPVYMTEWNLTVSHRDLLNDTTFKSCYLAKNLLESYDELDSFGYWTLTDLVEELQPSDDMFHGGLGLLTSNGVKKPHYYVFAALRRAGDRLLASGEGYFVTAGNDGVQIYLYNYEHFSHLFASGERYDMTYLERYAPFSEVGRMDFSLELAGLAPGTYRQREEVINADHGSAFDTWLRMGAPEIDPQAVEYIRQVSVPELIVNDVVADSGGSLTVSAVLEPLEVRVIELIPRGRRA